MFSSFKQGRRNRGGRSSKWHQKLRTAYNKNPNCHWCGIKTDIENRVGIGDQIPTAATLDHIYSNYDLRRLLKNGTKTVLACYTCNNKRSAAECRKVFPNSYDIRNNKISIIELLVGKKEVETKLSPFTPPAKFINGTKKSFLWHERKLNNVPNVQASVATDDDSSTKAGNQK